MSKITNDCLIRSGTGRMLYSCTHMATAGVKWLKKGTEASRHGGGIGRSSAATQLHRK